MNFIIEQDTMVQKHYRLQAHVLQLIKKNKYKKNKMKINLCEIEGKNTQDVKVYMCTSGTYYKHPFLLNLSPVSGIRNGLFKSAALFYQSAAFPTFPRTLPPINPRTQNITRLVFITYLLVPFTFKSFHARSKPHRLQIRKHVADKNYFPLKN